MLLCWLGQAEHADYIGEDVSQLVHGLQAATLARRHSDPELVLAALLHDLGHIAPCDAFAMGAVGRQHHEHVGADILRGLGFSERVAALVAGHVDAKRYLVATRPNYGATLSEASRETLRMQGGAMAPDECERFRQGVHTKALLQLRAWDEAAKELGASHGSLNSFVAAIECHLMAQDATQLQAVLAQPFCEQQRAVWSSRHCLALPGIIQGEALNRLRAWTQELAERPERPGRWMKYYERTEKDDRQLCRVEDFLPYHAGFDAFLRGESMLARLADLMGEEASLFKEKINFKLPGGSGFLPHQDAPAFAAFGQRYHVTVLVTVDASTQENGGLEFAEPVAEGEILAQAEDGTIAADLASRLTWQPLDLPAGSVVFFDSYIPHRSTTNQSQGARRSLYVTYNRKRDGERRQDYYRDKRQAFPPECERLDGVDYAARAGAYNLANPIR